jgi:exopolysaccharide biosynthesis polyprenyl glycosylphosphotransferase
LTEVVHEGVVVHDGVAVNEELVVHDGVVAHDSPVAQPTPEHAPIFEVDTESRGGWRYRERWIGLALAGLIVALTGALLAGQTTVRGAGLVGLTATISAVWFIGLRRSARFAQERQLKPVVAALIGTVTGAAAISLLNFWILDLVISPRELIAMATCVFLLAAGFQAVVAHGLSPRRRIVLVEPDNETRALIRELREARGADYDCIGVVEDGISPNGVPFLGGTDNLIAVLRRDRPDVLVCSTDSHARTVDRLLDAGLTSVHVLDTLEFQESALHRVESRSVSPAWFASVLDINRQNYSARAKRVFDVLVASFALIVTLPLLLVIPVLVRLSGPGPVLFRQMRIGESGELFQMLKFRSMVPDAENGQAVWASENDPRTTPVGRVLRVTRLDELPQLWNVIRGEMSIVGPRPERPEFLAVLGEHVPFWSRRDLLRPGITGWAQVHFAYTADISGAATKLSYDLYYLKHRSLALDALIVLKTFRVLLSRSGAR